MHASERGVGALDRVAALLGCLMKFDRRASDIDGKGERFTLTDAENETELEHVHRYLSVASLCRGKAVLDAACGEGYGSRILASFALKVDGVDIDAGTIGAAQQKYPLDNLRFAQADLCALPFEMDQFDVICSFETIEHIADPFAALAEFRRVLKPGGLLIISTPDKTIYNQSLAEPNSFHVREFERDEFLDVLKARFSHVESYGQRVVFGSLLAAEGDSAPLASWRREASGDVVGRGAYESAMYVVALCSARPLPQLQPGLYEGGVPQNALSSLLGGIADRDATIRRLIEVNAAALAQPAGQAQKPQPCRLCGASEFQCEMANLQPTVSAEWVLPAYRLSYCASCDSAYLSPTPTDDELRSLRSTSAEAIAIELTPHTVAPRVAYYASVLADRALLPEGGRVLELSAGLAWVSRAAKSLGSPCTTVAQDHAPDFAPHCSWVDRYHVGEVASLSEDAFDVIALTHALNREEQPAAVLAAAAEHLRPGGALLVTGPQRPRDWRPRDGVQPWLSFRHLQVPGGLNYLSREWFEQMSRRCGLSIEHWDPSHSDGEVFELVLRKPTEPGVR